MSAGKSFVLSEGIQRWANTHTHTHVRACFHPSHPPAFSCMPVAEKPIIPICFRLFIYFSAYVSVYWHVTPWYLIPLVLIAIALRWTSGQHTGTHLPNATVHCAHNRICPNCMHVDWAGAPFNCIRNAWPKCWCSNCDIRHYGSMYMYIQYAWTHLAGCASIKSYLSLHSNLRERSRCTQNSWFFSIIENLLNAQLNGKPSR